MKDEKEKSLLKFDKKIELLLYNEKPTICWFLISNLLLVCNKWPNFEKRWVFNSASLWKFEDFFFLKLFSKLIKLPLGHLF